MTEVLSMDVEKFRESLKRKCIQHVKDRRQRDECNSNAIGESDEEDGGSLRKRARKIIEIEIMKQEGNPAEGHDSMDDISSSVPHWSDLDHDEYEAMLISLEEALISELLQQDEAMLKEYETEEKKELADLHDAAASMPDGTALGKDSLLCPVCKRSWMIQSFDLQSLICSCGARLCLENDALTIADLRAELAETYDEHRVSGCTKDPSFEIKDDFGITLLMANCTTCLFQRVVL